MKVLGRLGRLGLIGILCLGVSSELLAKVPPGAPLFEKRLDRVYFSYSFDTSTLNCLYNNKEMVDKHMKAQGLKSLIPYHTHIEYDTRGNTLGEVAVSSYVDPNNRRHNIITATSEDACISYRSLYITKYRRHSFE